MSDRKYFGTKVFLEEKIYSDERFSLVDNSFIHELG
jgi:hypothetical protein